MSDAEPLRVAVVAAADHPVAEPFAGGLEAHVWMLTRALAERGHRVSLFAAPGSRVADDVSLLDVSTLDVHPVARGDVSMPSEPWLRTHHAYLDLMLELVAHGHERFDVVHNHSLHHLPIAMAPALTVPLLTTLHTPPTPWLQSAVVASRGRPGHLVAVSAHTARAWSDVADVGVLRNGVDVERWRPGPGGPRLVWSGRIAREKAPHLAVLGARRAGLGIDLAGPVSDPRYFAEELEPLLDGHHAVHHGHLAHADLARLVGAAAAALVTPEWDEPFGLVVAESLACGTPVAAFDRGGIGEVVDDLCGRLATPGDVDDLARAAREAVALRRDDARRRAVEHWSVGTMVGAYEDLYADLVAA